jgi:NADH:ubiquinone oxidoreductase subunit F (NADH-binding)
MTTNPHLVLDGIAATAAAVGAARTILCVERDRSMVVAALRHALDERPTRPGSNPVELALTPNRYVAGQETALVHWLNGGEARPTFGARPFERGVGGRPTLVDNVETLANVGLIARYGDVWYRQVGTRSEPGSMLVTVAGDVGRPGVLEIPIGCQLGEVLSSAGAATVRAVLVGGYFGTWLAGDHLWRVPISVQGLAELGARPGCGVIAVVPDGVCALAEVAAVAGWFAANSAGQCGACLFGLADIAGAMRGVVDGAPGAADAARRWANMVKGGGACQLPDGAACFVESALAVFADEVEEHRSGRCHRPYAGHLPVPAPAPAPGGWR